MIYYVYCIEVSGGLLQSTKEDTRHTRKGSEKMFRRHGWAALSEFVGFSVSVWFYCLEL